ncbi:MAG: Gfo/Idh/MocA family oxidoreductase [Candidatus Heimdallarchaeaceae archaeon]
MKILRYYHPQSKVWGLPAPCELKNCFKSWEDVLDKEKLVNIVIITIQDNLHTELVIKTKKKGYDVLLQNPMAQIISQVSIEKS